MIAFMNSVDKIQGCKKTLVSFFTALFNVCSKAHIILLLIFREELYRHLYFRLYLHQFLLP